MLMGSLSTSPSTPYAAIIDNFDLNPLPDVVFTARFEMYSIQINQFSDCYKMYRLLQFSNTTETPSLLFDGSCDECGCGSSGGVETADISTHFLDYPLTTSLDQDGYLDLVNFLTGGVEILFNDKGNNMIMIIV